MEDTDGGGVDERSGLKSCSDSQNESMPYACPAIFYVNNVQS